MSDWGGQKTVLDRLKRLWKQGKLLQPDAGQEFPLRIPLRHPSSAELPERFEEARNWITRLREAAERHGYLLEWKEIRHRQLGRNRLPVAAIVPDLKTALRLIGRQRDWRRFRNLAEQTLEAFPQLDDWLHGHPHVVLEHSDDWSRLLGFMAWLQQHPRPGIYLRQVELPGVHTKFIENHRRLLTILLDQVLPPAAIDEDAIGARSFARRYGFLEKPVLIRFRLLDPRQDIAGARDLALTAADFAGIRPSVRSVYITENEINGLAFPEVPESLVIFGLGYGLDVLGKIEWLREKQLFYWGDLDTHGFAMLDQLRADFPGARSLLMDEATLLEHRALWGREPRPTRRPLSRLTGEESRLYDQLRNDSFQPSLRLEQEQIGYAWVRAAVARSQEVE